MDRLETYAVGSSELTYDLIERIINDNTRLLLSEEGRQRIERCREYLDRNCLLYTSPSPRDRG